MPKPRKRRPKSGAATPKPAETHCAGDDYELTESEALRVSGDWRPKPAEETQGQKSKAAGLLTLVKNTRVFFYPACCFDWRPLLRFGLPGRFDCRTFVYCDWLRDLAGAFTREIAEVGRNPPPGHQLQCESVRDIQPHELTDAGIAAPMSFLRPDEITNYRRSFDRFATQDGWGRLAKLRHIANGEQRDLNLVYLGAEGVATYLQVFRAQRIAPYMLCTVNCGVGCGWTDFRLYHEALGRAVDLATSKPEYVVNEGRPPYDWPWKEVVEDFGDMKVFRRPSGTLKTGTEQSAEKGTEAASTPEQPKPQKKYPNPFIRSIPSRSKPPKSKLGFGFYGMEQPK